MGKFSGRRYSIQGLEGIFGVGEKSISVHKLSRKSFISLALNIRNHNVTALKEQHFEKYSFVDANSKQNAVVRNVSETSLVPCSQSVGVNHASISFTIVKLFAFHA